MSGIGLRQTEIRRYGAVMSRPSYLETPGASVAKRTFDVTMAALGLVLLFPLLVVLAGVIRLTMGAPVVFRQRRPGYRGAPFTIYKFRTMRAATNREGRSLPDGQRVTHVGRFLRRTSLDEILELFNVLKGDMSLVGPRPLLMEYLDRYSTFQARRHEVKPGLSGWAQINGRNAITWKEKFELDVWYVDHRTFWLDLKILGLTVVKVLRREGISAQGHATMPAFTGDSENIDRPGEPGN